MGKSDGLIFERPRENSACMLKRRGVRHKRAAAIATVPVGEPPRTIAAIALLLSTCAHRQQLGIRDRSPPRQKRSLKAPDITCEMRGERDNSKPSGDVMSKPCGSSGRARSYRKGSREGYKRKYHHRRKQPTETSDGADPGEERPWRIRGRAAMIDWGAPRGGPSVKGPNTDILNVIYLSYQSRSR